MSIKEHWSAQFGTVDSVKAHQELSGNLGQEILKLAADIKDPDHLNTEFVFANAQVRIEGGELVSVVLLESVTQGPLFKNVGEVAEAYGKARDTLFSILRMKRQAELFEYQTRIERAIEVGMDWVDAAAGNRSNQ